VNGNGESHITGKLYQSEENVMTRDDLILEAQIRAYEFNTEVSQCDCYEEPTPYHYSAFFGGGELLFHLTRIPCSDIKWKVEWAECFVCNEDYFLEPKTVHRMHTCPYRNNDFK
jgi:hypothetical protein